MMSSSTLVARTAKSSTVSGPHGLASQPLKQSGSSSTTKAAPYKAQRSVTFKVGRSSRRSTLRKSHLCTPHSSVTMRLQGAGHSPYPRHVKSMPKTSASTSKVVLHPSLGCYFDAPIWSTSPKVNFSLGFDVPGAGVPPPSPSRRCVRFELPTPPQKMKLKRGTAPRAKRTPAPTELTKKEVGSVLKFETFNDQAVYDFMICTALSFKPVRKDAQAQRRGASIGLGFTLSGEPLNNLSDIADPDATPRASALMSVRMPMAPRLPPMSDIDIAPSPLNL